MKGIKALRNVVSIQGSHGNWDYDEYMHGMFNGLELALAIMEDRDPRFRSAPEQFIAEGRGRKEQGLDAVLEDTFSSNYYRVDNYTVVDLTDVVYVSANGETNADEFVIGFRDGSKLKIHYDFTSSDDNEFTRLCGKLMERHDEKQD